MKSSYFRLYRYSNSVTCCFIVYYRRDTEIRATFKQSLHDQPRSGRPSTLNATEKELAKQYIKEEPRSLKHVVERLAQKTAKRLSISS